MTQVTVATKRTRTTINNKDGYTIGFATNKGLYLAFYNGKTCVILGKDGVQDVSTKNFQGLPPLKKYLMLFILLIFFNCFQLRLT